MFIRKLATLIGALILFLSFGSCNDPKKCCTYTNNGYTYYGCEGGNLYIDGGPAGAIPDWLWPTFEYMAYYYGGGCS